MPNAQCPIPNAQFPSVTHISEKGYISLYFINYVIINKKIRGTQCQQNRQPEK